ncbi:MAG: DUF2721 domain-containing protein [Myxococcota bacterium]
MSPELQDITHTIQVAVAPVFLLSAIGTTLAVFSTRLGRVVDRARFLEKELQHTPGEGRHELVNELRRLDQRSRLINWALTSGTFAALLVCLLIALAFLGYLFSVNAGYVVATLFIVAMVAIVLSLVFFLREVFLAIHSLRFHYPAEMTTMQSPAHQRPPRS